MQIKENLMDNRYVLVTGATDGIGKQTALGLAKMGAHVLLHGRNSQKGQIVINEIYRKTDNPNLELFIADLSSQRQIHELADSIIRTHDKLHVLINNAATYVNERRLTEDGIEITFAVNHLAPFLLTNLLLDLLKKNTPARIITVSSEAHSWLNSIDLSNLQGEKHFVGHEAYALSKLGNILFTLELAEQLELKGVTSNCLHPGKIITNLSRKAGLEESQGDNTEIGAQTSIYLASSPEVERLSGFYFEKEMPVRTSQLGSNKILQKKFWDISARLIKKVKYI
jgi:NAD(P)-dependent dehydrogenase (short-subunit alcohol dehydrogenase family)